MRKKKRERVSDRERVEQQLISATYKLYCKFTTTLADNMQKCICALQRSRGSSY